MGLDEREIEEAVELGRMVFLRNLILTSLAHAKLHRKSTEDSEAEADSKTSLWEISDRSGKIVGKVIRPCFSVEQIEIKIKFKINKVTFWNFTIVWSGVYSIRGAYKK